MLESEIDFLGSWAMFAVIGALVTAGNPDEINNRWGKVIGYSFLLTCVIRAVNSL